MEKLLIQYLTKQFSLDYVSITNYNIDGATCAVKYYADEEHHYPEMVNINVWGMIVFLNETQV